MPDYRNKYGTRRPGRVGAEKRPAQPREATPVKAAQQTTQGPLLKVLTSNRVGSRRDIAAAIKYGRVTVNGAAVENFSLQVNLKKDTVTVNGKRIQPEASRRIVLMFNKPAGIVTTTSDEMGRTTVIESLPKEYQEIGLYPVGRLDKESTGLLLITNDGDLTYRLTHPKFEHEKEYLVAVTGNLSAAELNAIRKGVPLEDGVTGLAILTEIKGQLPFNYRMIMHEGKKRQIRRTFEAFGYRVKALKRVRVGPVMLGTLAEGSVRELTGDEINKLSAKPVRTVSSEKKSQPEKTFNRKPRQRRG